MSNISSVLWMISFDKNKPGPLKPMRNISSKSNPVFAIISELSKGTIASNKWLNTTNSSLGLKALESLFRIQKAYSEIQELCLPKGSSSESSQASLNEVKRMKENLQYLSQIIKAIHDVMHQLGIGKEITE